ncbi:MAG: hypothetical protein JRJ15_11860 [Deltaproteobacteria bacterium]|nr:hypothetical protein [Deltaproteobacteria bacterium]
MQKHLSLAGRAGLVCLLLAILACANLSAVDKPLMNWTARQERLAGDQLEGGLLYPEQYFRKVREKNYPRIFQKSLENKHLNP